MDPKTPNPAPTPRARRLPRWARWALGLAALIAAGAYLASGFYFVQPDERAVVRRLGKVVEKQAPPGLHYAWPPPFGQVDKPQTTEVKRVTVGLDPETRAAIAAGDIIAQGRSTLTDVFTGDVNIVKATMVATYQISEPDKYVTRVARPEELVRLAVHIVMVQTLGGYSIDDALTEGKAKIQAERDRAQAMLERFDSGITLIDLNLESIEPPFAIAHAFRDVASAKKDQERAIDQAESVANEILPKARGRAYELTADAESYAERRIQAARGEAERFLAIREEYAKAPLVTRTRLLLDTLSDVIKRSKTYIFTPNESGPPLRMTISE